MISMIKEYVWTCEFLTDKFSIIVEIPALNIDQHFLILELESRSMLSEFWGEGEGGWV